MISFHLFLPLKAAPSLPTPLLHSHITQVLFLFKSLYRNAPEMHRYTHKKITLVWKNVGPFYQNVHYYLHGGLLAINYVK